MRGKTSLTTALLVSLVFVAALSAVLPPSFAIATVAVTPPSVIGPPPSIDETFSVNITVSSVVDLYSWQAGMTFNASVLEALSFTEGPFLEQGGTTIMVNGKINNTLGVIMYHACSLTGPVSGVDGSGTLATVAFRVKSYGTSALHLTDVVLLDSTLTDIPRTVSDGYFELTALRHDVAIINVTLAYPWGATVVFPGWNVSISVVAKNKGDYRETFNVTVYYNITLVVLQTIELDPGAETTLEFNWTTTGVPRGDYTIRAEASGVPTDVNPIDNVFTDGTVRVRYTGDASGDNFVDGSDLGILAAAWFKGYGHPDYDVNTDFNGDGFIDGSDLGLLADKWFTGG